jgi:hypothetical protein
MMPMLQISRLQILTTFKFQSQCGANAFPEELIIIACNNWQ